MADDILRGKVHIFGGGTISPVRNHLALCAPAYGKVARALELEIVEAMGREICANNRQFLGAKMYAQRFIDLHLTKMADPASTLVTNKDVLYRLDTLLDDPQTRVIVMSAALCDFEGSILDEDGQPTGSGSHAERLRTAQGEVLMRLTPAAKLIARIKNTRPDVLAVGFKTTTNAIPVEQFGRAMDMALESKVDIVLANDVLTRRNIVVRCDEDDRIAYSGTDRGEAVRTLAHYVVADSKIVLPRKQGPGA